MNQPSLFGKPNRVMNDIQEIAYPLFRKKSEVPVRQDHRRPHRHGVLCVDREYGVLNALNRLLNREAYRLFTASSAEEGLKILRDHDIHLVINGQDRPDLTQNGFLKRVQNEYPEVLRVLMTGYEGADTATELVISGYADRFFLKPWYDQHLKWEIRNTLKQYDLIQANKRLREKIADQQETLAQIEDRLRERLFSEDEPLGKPDHFIAFSRDILDNIPTPIVCVDADLRILLANRKARSISKDISRVQTGDIIFDYFPDFITGRISLCIHTDTRKTLNNCEFSGLLYRIDCIPFPEKAGLQGCFLVFRLL